MRLISWNVNGLRSCLGKGFLDFCAFADADIICLQETKMRPEQAQFDLPGYRMFWNSADKAGYSGTAVFTRREPLSVTYDFGAVFACISFAHDNNVSKTGFSCSSRFSYLRSRSRALAIHASARRSDCLAVGLGRVNTPCGATLT